MRHPGSRHRKRDNSRAFTLKKKNPSSPLVLTSRVVIKRINYPPPKLFFLSFSSLCAAPVAQLRGARSNLGAAPEGQALDRAVPGKSPLKKHGGAEAAISPLRTGQFNWIVKPKAGESTLFLKNPRGWVDPMESPVNPRGRVEPMESPMNPRGRVEH